MKNKKTSLYLVKALSFSFLLGSASSLSLLPSNAYAGSVGNAINKVTEKADELSDMELANIYVKKNPEASIYLRDSDQEFKQRIQNARSPQEEEKIRKDFKEQRAAEIQMYANLERKNRKMQALKAGDHKSFLVSEPTGYDDAKRMAAQCGRGESRGYSNYFGDKSFYSRKYPLLGPEFADIEAIPVLREQMLPRIDSTIRKFFKDKQLTFTSMELNYRRSRTHSTIHELGGQKDYSDKILRESGQRHERRSNNLSNELYQDVFNALERFEHTFVTRQALSRFQRESGYGKIERTGTQILTECKQYWADGNTVKVPIYNNRDQIIKYKRVGIEPGFAVAEPVRRRGEPLAVQNLVANEYDQKVNAKNIEARSGLYNERLATEEQNESAADVVKRNFGDDFRDPSSFKKVEGGMDLNSGSMSDYERNRNQEAKKSLKGSMVDEFSSGRQSKSINKINFDDVYR